MKTFKDIWETAANVTGPNVSMPADVAHAKKKKKKSVYDGRTKEGRKFVERILARRKAQENRAKKEQAKANKATIEPKE